MRLFRIHPQSDVRGDLLFNMKRQLIIKLCTCRASPKKHPYPHL
jgi:hypothetical protein